MRVIRPAVTQWDERLSVRISDDDFHDEFRPRHLSNGNLRTRLDEVWEGGDPDFSVFYEEDTYCPVCADTFSGYHCSCPECDSEDVELVRREVGPMVPPLPDGDMPWIYVESRWKAVEGSSGVIPVGRGKYVGHNDVGSTNPGACSSPGLTFNVRGDLTDICCKGSRCGLGTVDDHPLGLLELAQQYITEVRPSCYNCREQFAAWNKSRLARRKAKVYSELDSSIRKYKESVDAN
ncbi:MAG: hypothetical protein D4S01_07455 [Dehalococcoidia bacterium]|nr:MAG: hypothetical protein D4S01_07455 [Dehalococcoidia bacterium]